MIENLQLRQSVLWGMLLALILSGMLTAFQIDSQSPGTWQDHTPPVVFDPPSNHAYYPWVLYDANAFGDTIGGDIDGAGGAPDTYVMMPYYKMWVGKGSALQFAYSDDGINWIAYNNYASLSGLNNAHHAVLLYDAGGFGGGVYRYKVWYWRTVELYTGTEIRYAESVDGINWVNDQGVFGGTGASVVTDPTWWQRGSYGPITVFYNPSPGNTGPLDRRYVMYYDGTTGGIQQIGLAYSDDGMNWTRHTINAPILPVGVTGAWDSNYVTSGTVHRRADGTWEIWYSGGAGAAHEGIGYATSPDGLNWTRDPGSPFAELGGGTPLIGLGPAGSWNETRNYAPSVIYSATAFDDHGPACHYKMWRSGQDTSSNRVIGFSCVEAVLLPPTPTITPSSTPAATKTPQPVVSTTTVDLGISKIGFFVSEEQVEWVITVTNTSGTTGENVIITDTLPGDTQVDNVSGTDYSVDGQVITVVIPTLAPGERVQITVTSTVLSPGAMLISTVCLVAGNMDGERCATALVVTMLPQTGETPLWRDYGLLLCIAACVILLGMVSYRIQRLRSVLR